MPSAKAALDAFDDIKAPGTAKTEAPATYPGSKKKRKAVAEPVDSWANTRGFEYTYRGKQTMFYPVGVLAARLERLPQTIRKWEGQGYIPKTSFRTPGRTNTAQKRLYTRAQIEGIVKIAIEEGVIGDSNRNIGSTQFTARVNKLFKKLDA